MTTEKASRFSGLWPSVLVVLLIVGALFALTIFADDEREGPLVSQTVPSAEWTTAPEEGVEVDLPETPMRNVPVAKQTDGAPNAFSEE